MILERSESPRWRSNTYLVAPRPGGEACFVDAGGPVAPLLAAVDRHRLRPTHVLLTHAHHDHVAELAALRAAFPGIAVLAHPLERPHVDGPTAALVPGRPLGVAGLAVDVLHTPGHTAGSVAPRVAEVGVFTGDTLFAGSVGGVRGPGASGFADLRASVLDVLLALPGDTPLHPGHAGPTSVAAERAGNAFARVWRGEAPELGEPCRALGEPATLVVWGDDYDGGHKAHVRWADGADDLVGGSRVRRSGA